MAKSFDIETREAELRKEQRVAPMSLDEFTPEATETVANVRKVMGIPHTADIAPYFRIQLKHPGLFKAQMEMGIQIAGRCLVDRRDMELAVLRVGWRTASPYEWGEHVDIGKSKGLTDAEVARIPEGPGAAGWTDKDKAILTAVDELIDDYYISDATWAQLAGFWNEPQLLEFPMIVGAYVMTAMQQNSIRLSLHDDNPGLKHR